MLDSDLAVIERQQRMIVDLESKLDKCNLLVKETASETKKVQKTIFVLKRKKSEIALKSRKIEGQISKKVN